MQIVNPRGLFRPGIDADVADGDVIVPCGAEKGYRVLAPAIGDLERKNGGLSCLNCGFKHRDVVPRNVLVDADGDMYVVDAEIKRS